MIKIIDVIDLKQIEKKIGRRLTDQELHTAKHDKGHVSVVVSGKTFHLKLTLLIFPNDLIHSEEVEVTPWGQIHG